MTRERGVLRDILDIVEDLLDREDDALSGNEEYLGAVLFTLEKVLAKVEADQQARGEDDD